MKRIAIGGDATRAFLGILTMYRDLLKYGGSFSQFNRCDMTCGVRTAAHATAS